MLEVGVEAVNTICVLHLGEGASWPVFLLGLHHDIWAWWLTYSSRSLPVVQRLGLGGGGGWGERLDWFAAKSTSRSTKRKIALGSRHELSPQGRNCRCAMIDVYVLPI